MAKASSDERFTDIDFPLWPALEALDRKDYGWYSRLTAEQQRGFTPYTLLHWMSSIKASGLPGLFYVVSTDSRANSHMFNEVVSKHPELQWLMLCAASPGLGKQFHKWIPHLPVAVTNLKAKAKAADIAEYFSKCWPDAGDTNIKEAAAEYVAQQHHKWRIAQLFPELKLADIEALATVSTPEQVDEWINASGG